MNTLSRLFSGSGDGFGCRLPRPRPVLLTVKIQNIPD